MYFHFFVAVSYVSDNGRGVFLIFFSEIGRAGRTPRVRVSPDFFLVCFLQPLYYLTCPRITARIT